MSSLPLVLPKQTQAPLANGIFEDAWYLFFQVAQMYASSGAQLARYGTRATRLEADVEGLVDGTLWTETDTGLIYQWRAGLLEWMCIAGTQKIQQTLTSPTTTNINAPTTGAPRLVYFLDMDPTGGRPIHWNTGFAYTSDDLGPALASKRNIFVFDLDPATGLYNQSGQPNLNVTP